MSFSIFSIPCFLDANILFNTSELNKNGAVLRKAFQCEYKCTNSQLAKGPKSKRAEFYSQFELWVYFIGTMEF